MRTMRQDGGSRNKWVATPRCSVGNDARGCGNRDGWWGATPRCNVGNDARGCGWWVVGSDAAPLRRDTHRVAPMCRT